MEDSRAIFIMVESIKDTTERVEKSVVRLEEKVDRKLEARDKQCKIDQRDMRKDIGKNQMSIVKIAMMVGTSATIGASIASIF